MVIIYRRLELLAQEDRCLFQHTCVSGSSVYTFIYCLSHSLRQKNTLSGCRFFCFAPTGGRLHRGDYAWHCGGPRPARFGGLGWFRDVETFVWNDHVVWFLGCGTLLGLFSTDFGSSSWEGFIKSFCLLQTASLSEAVRLGWAWPSADAWLRGVNCGRSGCFIGRFSRASHNIKKHLLKVLVIPPVICCSSSSPRQPGPPHPSAFLTDVIITGRIDWEVWTAGCQRLVTFHAGRVLDVYTSQRVVWNASAQVAIRDSTLGKATVLLAAHLNLHGYSETAMLTENFYLVCWVSFEVQAVLFSGLPPQPLERF